MTQRYALKIAYIGWNYQGFQRQKDPIKTVEGTIIKTIENLGIITETKPKGYSSAGRTDRGVHALNQVIAFDSPKKEIYLEEINLHLPSDIYAWGIAKVDQSFNARRDALKRTYKMFSPHSNENFGIMKQVLEKLIGTHDFKKLSKKADILPSGQEKSTILTLDIADVRLIEKMDTLEFTFTSRSFLWHQVRKMVSLTLDIGSNKYPFEIVNEVLNPKSKLPKGGIEPAAVDGLVLFNVQYPDVTFEIISKKELIKSKLIKEIFIHSSRLSVLNLLEEKILNKDLD